jgi:hypothetical protein
VTLAEAGIIGPANAPVKHFAITAEALSPTATTDATPAPHPPEEPAAVNVDGYPQPVFPKHVPANKTVAAQPALPKGVPVRNSDASPTRDGVLR